MNQNEWIMRLLKLAFIVSTVVLLIIKVPAWYTDIKYNREWKARMQYFNEHGRADVRRGGYVQYNKPDTIKNNIKDGRTR